jgi:serine/threonine-protein kinase
LQPELVELTARGGICLHPHLTAADLPGELTLPINMAPEQVVGDPSDAKSDVFLLGALLYRMLTGQAPFEGDEEGISQRIRHHPPTPIRALAREVPSPIAKVVMRCLAKRRHDRIPDMVSLAARLTRVLRAETSLPSEQLVTRALSRAGLAEPLPAPLDRDAERGIMTPRAMLRRHGLTLALASAIALAAVVSWRSLRDDASDSRSTPRGVLDSPAHLRVLARPWAEVYIDNKLVDTTPIGFPIPVAPGRHIVVLRHPAAPDEARTVDLIAGQTMLIDVDMNVRRPAASAAPAPSATAD